MVGLQFVSVAGRADTLKVFRAVWIASLQSPDEPCRHNVVHMALDSCLLEIHSARLYFALSPQGWCPQTPPSFPQRAPSRPLAIHTAPTDRPLLGTEARP